MPGSLKSERGCYIVEALRPLPPSALSTAQHYRRSHGCSVWLSLSNFLFRTRTCDSSNACCTFFHPSPCRPSRIQIWLCSFEPEDQAITKNLAPFLMHLRQQITIYSTHHQVYNVLIQKSPETITDPFDFLRLEFQSKHLFSYPLFYAHFP